MAKKRGGGIAYGGTISNQQITNFPLCDDKAGAFNLSMHLRDTPK